MLQSDALSNYQELYGVRRVDLFIAPEAPMLDLGILSGPQMSFRMNTAEPAVAGLQNSFYDTVAAWYDR